MKKSLIILSLMGLSATQVNASVQHTFQPVESNSLASVSNTSITPLVQTASITRVDGFSDITSNNLVVKRAQDLELLSSQLQESEDNLSKLAEKLNKKYETTSFATSQNNQSSYSRLDNSAPPALAAARASRAARSRTIGLCARYVRKALQSAGYKFTPNPSAYQYATRGTLANAGFVKISNNSSPQVGDVVVYNRSSKHPHGHIQIFDGKNWISDFRQAKKSPYSGNYSYTTWRDARYLNDASNEGIYLAMDE